MLFHSGSICGQTPRSWYAAARPSGREMSWPQTTSLPALAGRTSPVRAARVVVLPAPFGPRSPKHSPLRTPRLMPRTAGVSSHCLLTLVLYVWQRFRYLTASSWPWPRPCSTRRSSASTSSSFPASPASRTRPGTAVRLRASWRTRFAAQSGTDTSEAYSGSAAQVMKTPATPMSGSCTRTTNMPDSPYRGLMTDITPWMHSATSWKEPGRSSKAMTAAAGTIPRRRLTRGMTFMATSTVVNRREKL
mmetsp:Transcript_45995/g.137466  ORF Transcript_45995/g.137466 Transcript_45995/m.137466 type:complete len:247 (+) Transcript_45995:109-849(+)